MNTMLELSMDADYDVMAAVLIISFAVVARLWIRYQCRLENKAD